MAACEPRGRAAAAHHAWRRAVAAVATVTWQALRFLLTLAGFAGFYLGGAVLSWLVLPVMNLRATDPVARARRTHRLVRRALRLFHGYLNVTRGFRVCPEARALPLDAGPCVWIANHPTLIDVTAVVATYGGACLVAKRELFRNPLVARVLRHGWHIEAHGGAVVDGTDVVSQAVERLRAGFSVLIFPEGTRSPSGGLLAFKRGAFEIAARAGVPLIPIVLVATPPMLSHDVPWWRIPKRSTRLSVTPLPAVSAESWGRDSRAMMRDIEALYARHLKIALHPPTGTGASPIEPAPTSPAPLEWPHGSP